MNLLEIVGSILTELEKVHQKLDRLLASGGEKDPKCSDCKEYPCTPGYCDDYEFFEPKEKLPEVKEEITVSNFTLPKTGKYQWYRLKDDDKVKLRRCSNEGCPMFLKFNEDKKKYEHWKYDANTGVGGYVQDTCDYYMPEVKG